MQFDISSAVYFCLLDYRYMTPIGE